LLELLLTIDHAVERAFYLKQLAERLQLPEHIIQEEWRAMQKKHTQSQLQKHRKPEAEKTDPATEEQELADNLGVYLLQILLRYRLPSDLSIDPAVITQLSLKRIFEYLVKWWQTHEDFQLSAFTAHLPDELQEMVSTLYIKDFPVEDTLIDRELRVTITQLQQRWRKQRLTELSEQLGSLEAKESLTSTEELEFHTLQKELQTLMNAR